MNEFRMGLLKDRAAAIRPDLDDRWVPPPVTTT